MPRKKASEVPATAPARLNCPACKSEISADGATLHARSSYLEDLIDSDAVVEKLEKLVEGLEQKLAAAKQEQEAGKAKAVAVAAQTKTEEKKNGTLEQGQGKRGGNWW